MEPICSRHLAADERGMHSRQRRTHQPLLCLLPYDKAGTIDEGEQSHRLTLDLGERPASARREGGTGRDSRRLDHGRHRETGNESAMGFWWNGLRDVSVQTGADEPRLRVHAAVMRCYLGA